MVGRWPVSVNLKIARVKKWGQIPKFHPASLRLPRAIVRIPTVRATYRINIVKISYFSALRVNYLKQEGNLIALAQGNAIASPQTVTISHR